MIEELNTVVLTTDIPEHGLCAGDVGTVVLTHQGGSGYTVEFMTLKGDTVAVVTLPAASVRATTTNDISHVRELEVAS